MCSECNEYLDQLYFYNALFTLWVLRQILVFAAWISLRPFLFSKEKSCFIYKHMFKVSEDNKCKKFCYFLLNSTAQFF